MIVRGIHLPEGDRHFAEQIEAGPLYRGKGTYQFAKLEAALAHCERRRHAVDVGAHIGLWSRVLSYEFKRVTAFEPIDEYARCFGRNLARRAGVQLHREALAEGSGVTSFSISANGIGTARAAVSGDIRQVEVRPLDGYLLEGVDFLKVDCEGSELLVIRGGEETIRRDKPVVVIEQKPKRTAAYGFPRMGAVDLLRSWGAELVSEMKGDFLMAWPNG